MEKSKKVSYFKKGIITGIGSAIGLTIGFALVSTLLAFFLKSIGGVPLVGGWIADIVESTQESLVTRSPKLSN